MIRPLSYRLLCLLLAVVTVGASVGLHVQRHTCRWSGRSTVKLALGNPAVRGCGGGRAELRRSSCCEVSTQLHQLSATGVVQAETQTVATAPPLAAWPTPVVWAPAAGWAGPAAAPAGARWLAADGSPPRAGRALLSWVCRWSV